MTKMNPACMFPNGYTELRLCRVIDDKDVLHWKQRPLQKYTDAKAALHHAKPSTNDNPMSLSVEGRKMTPELRKQDVVQEVYDSILRGTNAPDLYTTNDEALKETPEELKRRGFECKNYQKQ